MVSNATRTTVAMAGKALADPEFRQKLMDDPEAAVKEAGIELTPDQMKALKEMDKEQFEQGLVDLDKRLTMGCWEHIMYKIDAISVEVHPDATEVTPITIPETVCSWR